VSGLIQILAEKTLRAYNGQMEIVNFPPKYESVGARGECPHCKSSSLFYPMCSSIDDDHHGDRIMVSATKCMGCKQYLLVVGVRLGGLDYKLVEVYPLGTPNDKVAAEVPTEIREDLSEAKRCEWIKAYKGCVVLCRRAIQSSVIALGAKGGRLVDQIDNLGSTGKITEALKEFAHEVRLIGNDGAHPDKDGLNDVTPEDAADMLEFARQYMDHVYVMPAMLKARREAQARK
jgi:hypothetical protein